MHIKRRRYERSGTADPKDCVEAVGVRADIRTFGTLCHYDILRCEENIDDGARLPATARGADLIRAVEARGAAAVHLTLAPGAGRLDHRKRLGASRERDLRAPASVSLALSEPVGVVGSWR